MPTVSLDGEGVITTRGSRSWGTLTWYLRNANAQMSSGTRMGRLHRFDLPGQWWGVARTLGVLRDPLLYTAWVPLSITATQPAGWDPDECTTVSYAANSVCWGCGKKGPDGGGGRGLATRGCTEAPQFDTSSGIHGQVERCSSGRQSPPTFRVRASDVVLLLPPTANLHYDAWIAGPAGLSCFETKPARDLHLSQGGDGLC